MLILYRALGAQSNGPVLFSTTDNFHEYKRGLSELLSVREETLALAILQRFEWGLRPSDFWIGDSFEVLYAGAYVEDYEFARSFLNSPDHLNACRVLAETLRELGAVRLRYIGVSLDQTPKPKPPDPNALTAKEIRCLVTDYIGVTGGYLGDFSYRTHRELYEDLNLSYNPDTMPGTTKERFIAILSNATAREQAQIADAILSRYPENSTSGRTPKLKQEILRWVNRLNNESVVQIDQLQKTNASVARALDDAEKLLQTNGATSAVDRVHTALHGYMRGVAVIAEISVPEDASITSLFKALRISHPKFQDLGPRSEDITKALQGIASVVDALNPLRNKASIAHPNVELLAEPEALLVVNSIRTILNYLDKRLK